MYSVGVFGSSLPIEGSHPYEEARQIGREIARRGGRVICGGYGGTMEAVCRGAAEERAETVGIVLSGKGPSNPWVSRPIEVADLSERLTRLRDESDAWLFLPRGLGTLLELVWFAESVVKGDAQPRPMVFLGEFWRAAVETVRAEAAGPGATLLADSIRFTAAPPEAVLLAWSGFS